MEFSVNDYVINFGVLGRIIEIIDNDSIVLVNERIGKWIASTQNCVKYL